MPRFRLTAATVLAAGLAAAPAMAALNTTDQDFFQHAATGGKAEVALGHLAETNAAAPKIKAFGQRMVTDHGQANQALEQIAHRQDLALPAGLDPADSETERNLRGLKGEEFDAAYLRDMTQGHKTDIAEFQKEASSGKDPELRAFAQKYLPVLQEHLRMAETLEPERTAPNK